MNNSLFDEAGHIRSWVFCPSAWNGDDVWFTGFSSQEKDKIFAHMKMCLKCRQAEIESVLQWAVLRPRATNRELIPIKTAETGRKGTGIDSDSAILLVKQIKECLGQLDSYCDALSSIIKSGGDSL